VKKVIKIGAQMKTHYKNFKLKFQHQWVRGATQIRVANLSDEAHVLRSKTWQAKHGIMVV